MNTKAKTALLYAASFFLPFVLMFVAYAALHIAPFGNETLLIADAQEMYVSDLAFLKRFLQGEENLLYTFEIGFGMPHLGQLTYMLNPSNLIVVFFDLEHFPEMYSLLTAINFSVCGLTMFIFLSSVYGRSASNLIFSTIYAFIGFNVANCFNYNFFVDVELLPLVALGLKNIVNGKAPWLYLFTLAFSIFSSFYFGFFLCVASVVLFLMFLAERNEKDPTVRKVIWFRYSSASVIAGLLPAFLWVPALLSFFGGRAEQNGLSDFSVAETMSFAEAFAKLFTGANGPLEVMNGKPNIFCGTFVVFLVIFFFVDRKNTVRQKLIRGLPLIFYFTTFYVQALSMVMNGLIKTNWFNFRYSFVFSFLLILIAYEQFRKLKVPAVEEFKRTCLIFATLVVVTFSQKFSFIEGGNVVYDVVILSICLTAVWLTWSTESQSAKKLLIPRILVLCSIQCVLNFTVCTKQLKVMSITKEDYLQETSIGKEFSRKVKSNDDTLYRSIVDPTHNKKKLAPRLYGYNGSNYFGSAEQTFVFEGFGKLGMNWWRNRMWYPEGMPAPFDSLLGVKFILSALNLQEIKGYIPEGRIDKFVLYRNTDALPIAIPATEKITSLKLGKNIFENHNNIWKAITGNEKNIFTEEVDIDFVVHTGHDGVSLTSAEARQHQKLISERNEKTKSTKQESTIVKSDKLPDRETPESIVDTGSYIECRFVAKHDGNVYSHVERPDEVGGSVDKESVDTLRYLGKVKKGDVVKDYIAVNEKITRDKINSICADYRVANERSDVLALYSKEIRTNWDVTTRISDHHLKLKVHSENQGRLFFVIPFDAGWRLITDGQEDKLEKTADLFMSSKLFPGVHEVDLEFNPKGYDVGFLVSGIGLILLLIGCGLGNKRRWRPTSCMQAKKIVDKPQQKCC